MNKHSQSSSTSFATGPRPKSSYFPNSAGIFKSLMNGAAGLAALVLLIAPSVSTLISMVTALVLLALVLRLKTLGSRTRLLSIRVPTELTLLTTTLVLCVILAEFGLRLFLFQSFLDVHRFPQITGNVGLTDSHPQLERFLQVSGLPFVNLGKAPRLGPGDHWNAAGHTFVCDRVEKFLVSGKYLRKKEQRPAAPGTFPGESTHFSSKWPQPPPSWLGHP